MADERSVRIGLVQMSCSPDADANLQKALSMTRQAAKEGAQVVCLPELFRSRYFCQSEDHDHFRLAERIPGPSTEAFEALAREEDIVVVASLFEKRTEGLYHNTVAVIDRAKGYIGKYRKMHIPDDPLYYEKFYFTPGDLGFKSFETSRGNLGTLICWDQWYPEAARLTALRGAEILFYPTAIGWHPHEKERFGKAQHEAWELAQRAHAVANGCFVVAVNRIGFEPTPGYDEPDAEHGIHFWGQSFACAPNGTVIARAGEGEETVLVVQCDLAQLDEFRTHWPFLRDRRIDAYSEITRRFIDVE